jgi:autotransporter-associated beta strand protein
VATTAVLTSSALLSIIRENKLIAEEKLQAVLRDLSPTVLSGEDALPLCDALVEQKLLTRFQVNLLLQGKSKSLRITSKYRLLDRLGAGGMGLVYLCEHIRMKRLVALKVLPNSQAKEAGNLERFHREAQAVAALKHPNIVQAYDVDSDNGIHYLVMEYIDGVNLEKLVSKRGPLDPVRAAHYIAQAADGLQHAAERGLVHRDIKPSNLLIDRQGYVKLLDMGLARFFDTRTDNITERYDNNAVIGTADFIAPEQALNSHEVDIRADIYSLGCTFYYLLTGKAPYHDANITQKLLLHQMREPKPIEEFVPDIDPDLVEVVRRMMAKKVEDRFQAPGEVAAALAPWTEETIAPPSPEELPENMMAGGFDVTATGSTVTTNITSSIPKQAPRPSRGMVTERITESAIRRMDEPSKSDEEATSSKRRYLIGGALLLVAVGGFVLVAVKPWDNGGTPPPTKSGVRPGSDEDVASLTGDSNPNAGKNPNPPPKKEPPIPKTNPLGAGMVHVRMDFRSPRPTPQRGEIRATPTDLLIFSGPELRRNGQDEAPMLDLLRKQQIGGNGGVGSPNAPIIPYAIALVEGHSCPDTLLTVDNRGGLRPLTLSGKEYFTTNNFAGAKPDLNALVGGNVTLPKGLTTVNALVAEFWDFSAAREGSTLRLASGAAVFMGTTTQRSFVFGSGEGPLALDFNGKTGFITVSGEQDFTKLPGGREYVLRAKLVNFGGNPLVISGISGSVLRLDNGQNQNPRLVVQGHQLLFKDKLFRVSFNDDSQLGPAKAPVSLVDAALVLSIPGSVDIDRPLALEKTSQLITAKALGQIRWIGKISGGALTVAGPGSVVLTRADNDYAGGTEIWGGTLILQAENGTPAGTGHVSVHATGTLTGAGKIVKNLAVKGGALQPGNDDGKPLICGGSLFFEVTKARDAKNKDLDRFPKVQFRLNGPGARPLDYSGPLALNFASANVEVVLLDNFVPTPETKCFVAINRMGARIVSGFKNAPHLGSVMTQDGKWIAQISYEGNADRGTVSGGADVVLFNFAPAPP